MQVFGLNFRQNGVVESMCFVKFYYPINKKRRMLFCENQHHKLTPIAIARVVQILYMIEHIACVIFEGSGALRKKNKTSKKFPSFNTLANIATRHISLHWRTQRTLTMLSKHKTRKNYLRKSAKKFFIKSLHSSSSTPTVTVALACSTLGAKRS